MTKSTSARILPILFLSVCGIILSSCTTTSVFDARACPRERQYTAKEQSAFLNDYPKAPKTIQSLVVDYEKLRDKSRACRGERVSG